MIINVTYDASVAGAPAGFKAAIDYAVDTLDSLFTNPVTLNIDIGWGETNGQVLGPNDLGEQHPQLAGQSYSYAQLRAALGASLPAADPTGGGAFDISTADAKALGLVAGNGAAIDGWAGFDSAANAFTFDPGNRAVPGETDFIGIAFHELTEIMGRTAGLGGVHGYAALDLFRYSAPGVPLLAAGPAYFSTDGGMTDLDNFNANPSGDAGDWALGAGNDSFLAFVMPGVADALTPTDLTTMAAIGWDVAVPASPSGPVGFVQQFYETELARPGSVGEVAFWTNQLGGSALTETQLAEGFAGSAEAQADILPVAEFYQALFGRAPDPAGLNFWAGALRSGETPAAIAAQFAGDAEFRFDTGASSAAPVTTLYQDILGRAPDSAGDSFWVNFLAQHGDGPAALATAAMDFVLSAEFAAHATGPVETWLTVAGTTGLYASAITGISIGVVGLSALDPAPIPS